MNDFRVSVEQVCHQRGATAGVVEKENKGADVPTLVGHASLSDVQICAGHVRVSAQGRSSHKKPDRAAPEATHDWNLIGHKDEMPAASPHANSSSSGLTSPMMVDPGSGESSRSAETTVTVPVGEMTNMTTA